MHAARSAMNQEPRVREWAEQFMKNKERAGQASMPEEDFEKHWRYGESPGDSRSVMLLMRRR